jgi:hypothetical protein
VDAVRAVAADVTLDDAMLQLYGPLVLITSDLHEFDDDVADRIVDLFLASHRPVGAAGAKGAKRVKRR